MSLFTEHDIEGIGLKVNENGTVEINYPSEIKLDLETAKIIDALIKKEVQNHPFYLIVNFENVFGHLPDDVQHFFAKEAPSIPQIITAVYIINNLPVRMLTRFYIRVFKPNYPVEIVSSYKRAIDWVEKNRIERENKNKSN